MENEEKYFNYDLRPGRVLNKRKYLNDGTPLISIITPYYNCKDYIMETANSIINQTFPYWEWIIINDGSNEEGTEKVLNEVRSLDERIKIFDEKNEGRLAARDKAIKKSQCDLIFVIDSDDQIDCTMLECAYWTLMTNPDASWVYADMVNFDGAEFLWKKLFDCNIEKKENIIPVCSLIRKEALLNVGGYGAVDKDVHEDWHMWLRMLEKGYFPIRMNYYGFWYRKKKEGGVLDSINNDKKRDEHAREEIRKQADKIKNEVGAIQFPTSVHPNYDTYPYIFDWNRKPINVKGEKIRLLFIFPWFRVGGADKFNFDLVSNLDKEKYEITIITTEPSEYVWRQKFEEYAEIFDLSSFLQRKDWASFFYYIIKSRNIDVVIESNSFYGYYVIPWLKSEFPNVVFTDYLHSADWTWRNGAYPRDSGAIDNFLDKTYTCTNSLKVDMLSKMNRGIDNIKPVYIGVNEKEFSRENVDIEENLDLKKALPKIKDKKVILFLCRISEEKRPILMEKIFKKLLERDKDIILFVVGDGPILNEMKDFAKKDGIYENIIFFGMQKNVKQFYKVADVSVICSLIEGLTITTYESLSMGTPVVTADVGGQKELVDNTCGRVVQNIQDSKTGCFDRNYSEEEINRYAEAILEVLSESDKEKIIERCRKKVLNGFTIDNMVKTFDIEFENFAKNGTSINLENVKNKDLYKQYVVLFNQLDQREYFVNAGGQFNLNSELEKQRKAYKISKIKEKLWRNPLWRGLVKISKAMHIDILIKKMKIKEKTKKILIKFV